MQVMVDPFFSFKPIYILANYLGRWKCISILKGDASQSRPDRNFSANPGQITPGAVRYLQQPPVQMPARWPGTEAP